MNSSQDDLSNQNANLEDALRGLKPVGVGSMQKGRDLLQYELGYQAGKRNSVGWQMATWALALTLVGSWTFNRSVNNSGAPSENWSSDPVPQNENFAVISDPLPESGSTNVSIPGAEKEDQSTQKPVKNQDLSSHSEIKNQIELPFWLSWIGIESSISPNSHLATRQRLLELGVDALPEFSQVSRFGSDLPITPLTMRDGMPWEFFQIQ